MRWVRVQFKIDLVWVSSQKTKETKVRWVRVVVSPLQFFLTIAGKQSLGASAGNMFLVSFCPSKPEDLFIGLSCSMKNALAEGTCKHFVVSLLLKSVS